MRLAHLLPLVENMPTVEVETEVYAYPSIQEAATVAVPSELGEDEALVAPPLVPRMAWMWASPSSPDTFNDMMCSGERYDEDEKELHG